VLGSGDCLGCGTCLLFGGLLDASPWLEQPTAAHGAVGGDEDHRVDEEADEEA
jgi:hypothetical protein